MRRWWIYGLIAVLIALWTSLIMLVRFFYRLIHL